MVTSAVSEFRFCESNVLVDEAELDSDAIGVENSAVFAVALSDDS